MALGVHTFTDLVNLQTVCKSTDLQVYKSMDSRILYSPSVFQEKSQLVLNTIAIVTC